MKSFFNARHEICVLATFHHVGTVAGTVQALCRHCVGTVRLAASSSWAYKSAFGRPSAGLQLCRLPSLSPALNDSHRPLPLSPVLNDSHRPPPLSPVLIDSSSCAAAMVPLRQEAIKKTNTHSEGNLEMRRLGPKAIWKCVGLVRKQAHRDGRRTKVRNKCYTRNCPRPRSPDVNVRMMATHRDDKGIFASQR